MRTPREKAVNADLWAELLELCERHAATFVWVRGHAGDPENEYCDQLAESAARRSGLPADAGYEEAPARLAAQPSLFDGVDR
jgi:ribonuclease HI